MYKFQVFTALRKRAGPQGSGNVSGSELRSWNTELRRSGGRSGGELRQLLPQLPQLQRHLLGEPEAGEDAGGGLGMVTILGGGGPPVPPLPPVGRPALGAGGQPRPAPRADQVPGAAPGQGWEHGLQI